MPSIDVVNQTASKPRCYRPRRYYLHVGIAGGVLSITTGIGLTALAFLRVDCSLPGPISGLIIPAVICTGFTLISAWIILGYMRERLHLAMSTVTQRGIFRMRTVNVGDITRLKWRGFPVNGSMIIRTYSTKLIIYLDNFAAAERLEICLFFREKVDLSFHEGWSQYEERWLMRRSKPSWQGTPMGRVILGTVFLALAVLFGWCWLSDWGAHYLFFSLLSIVRTACCPWLPAQNQSQELTRQSDS